MAALLAIDPQVVYAWQRRFKADGLLGVSPRVSVQVMMDVFQLRDNDPLLGHSRVKMAFDSLGYRYGHPTVRQLVALDKQAHPSPKPAPYTPRAEERPLPTTAPHQGWFVDVRDLVKLDGHRLSSILRFDGDSQAIAQWGAPDAAVSDNAGGPLALSPCLQPLGIRWAPMVRGHPWQNLAEGGFASQRRRLEAYVAGCPHRETGYRRHAQFVKDDQCWGHGAHTRTEAQGRIYSLSPEVILGSARGRAVEPARLRRVFRLRQQTRQVRQQGQIRRHNFGLSIDPGLWGPTVDVSISDEARRLEQAEHLLVSYPCISDPRQRRLTAVDGTGRQQSHRVPVVQRMLWAPELVRTVWRRPRYRRASWRRAALHAPQVGLFASFASSIVHIRGGDSRTLHYEAKEILARFGRGVSRNGRAVQGWCWDRYWRRYREQTGPTPPLRQCGVKPTVLRPPACDPAGYSGGHYHDGVRKS